MRPTVLEVFDSCLSEITQTFKINNAHSDRLNIKIGIPQRIALGPILFITYINSLTNQLIENGPIVSYTDDTAAIVSKDTWNQAR